MCAHGKLVKVDAAEVELLVEDTPRSFNWLLAGTGLQKKREGRGGGGYERVSLLVIDISCDLVGSKGTFHVFPQASSSLTAA